MRNNSSRQFVGRMGAELKNHAPALPALGDGIRLSRPCTLGSLGSNPGITFRLGVCPVASRKPGTAGQSGVSGHRSLKSPVRCAAPGTATLNTCPGTRSRRHSCDQKKNDLCLSVLYTFGMKIGPPTV